MVTPNGVLNLNRATSVEEVSHIKGCFLIDAKAPGRQEYIPHPLTAPGGLNNLSDFLTIQCRPTQFLNFD